MKKAPFVLAVTCFSGGLAALGVGLFSDSAELIRLSIAVLLVTGIGTSAAAINNCLKVRQTQHRPNQPANAERALNQEQQAPDIIPAHIAETNLNENPNAPPRQVAAVAANPVIVRTPFQIGSSDS